MGGRLKVGVCDLPSYNSSECLPACGSAAAFMLNITLNADAKPLFSFKFLLPRDFVFLVAYSVAIRVNEP